jgi:NitT/TauT family transport system substrate-binding protein
MRMILSALAVALFALATPARADELAPLRIRLDWTPWGNQAAFHLANAKGWYKEAGLDVTIDDGNGSTGTVQIVGTGSDYDVGFAALSSMVIARGKGLPVRAIAAYARNSDIGVMVPLDSGITTIAGLKGKKIGYTASSLETPFLDSFLKAGGLTKADVELINMEGAAKLGAYISGKTDAAFSAIPFLVPAVNEGRPSRGIGLSAAGLAMPSYGLFARQSVIDARRDVLTRFVTVTDAAWAYIIAGHEDEGVAAIRAARPNAKLNAAAMRAQIDSFITFFPTPATKGMPPGRMAEADWQAAVETMRGAKLIPDDVKAADLYTDALFDPALYQHIAAQ